MTLFSELSREMLLTPPDNSVLGWVVFLLLWLVTLLFAGLIVYGILAAINYWFMPVLEGKGEIVGMHFEPAHYTTTYMYNAATKTSMPVTTWHDDAWKLVIDIDGAEDDFYLSQYEYVKHKVGQVVPVEYSTGRLWKSISIKSLSY